MSTKRALTFSILLAGIAFAASTDPTSTASAQPSGPSQVIVANSTAQPVPTVTQGTTTIAGTVALAAGTQVSLAGTVALANDAGNPVYVQTVAPAITTSTLVKLVANTQFTELAVAKPACPDGSTFLVTDLTANPGPNASGFAVIDSDWAGFINGWQWKQSGDAAVSFSAWAHGLSQAVHASPGGQPVSPQGSASAVIYAGIEIHTPVTADTWFDLHITGHCGHPFVAP